MLEGAIKKDVQQPITPVVNAQLHQHHIVVQLHNLGSIIHMPPCKYTTVMGICHPVYPVLKDNMQW